MIAFPPTAADDGTEQTDDRTASRTTAPANAKPTTTTKIKRYKFIYKKEGEFSAESGKI